MSILLGLVGDLLIDRADPSEALDRVRPLLDACDLRFGNLEGAFTDRPEPGPASFLVVCPPAHNLDAFAEARFDVLSMANNHIVDGGRGPMLDARERLRARGVATCGAGTDLADARRPALVTANGVTMAFLAYACVFPMGFEAQPGVPGLVPLRAYNFYRPLIDSIYTPGTPPRIETVTDEADLAAVADDIAKVRTEADLVFTSFHWGDFLRPFHLTDLETRTARWCIDQGVDMVIGHHHHALRGAEWYKGKPIFYGLGHFVFDLRFPPEMMERAEAFAASFGPDSYAVFPRPGWPLLPLHPDTRMTMLAYARATKDGVSDIGFVPCRLRPDGRVEAVDPESDEGREVVAYVARCNADQKLDARITAEGSVEIAGHRSLRIVPAA